MQEKDLKKQRVQTLRANGSEAVQRRNFLIKIIKSFPVTQFFKATGHIINVITYKENNSPIKSAII